MVKKAIIFLLHFYKRLVSPWLGMVIGGACRYHPTCSEYASQAFKDFGIIKGSWLSVKRIIKCNPMSKSYLDPVVEISNHNS